MLMFDYLLICVCIVALTVVIISVKVILFDSDIPVFPAILISIILVSLLVVLLYSSIQISQPQLLYGYAKTGQMRYMQPDNPFDSTKVVKVIEIRSGYVAYVYEPPIKELETDTSKCNVYTMDEKDFVRQFKLQY